MISGAQDCKADFAARGTVWVLEGPNITISYHYDGGYDERFGSGGVANIHDYQQKIATILENVFDADVTLVNSATAVTASRADSCSYSINANCSHISATSCVTNCEKSPYNTSHHKNANDMLLYWYSQLPAAAKGKTIHMMYSGHIPCYVTDEDKDGKNDTHKIMASNYVLNGLTYAGNSRVAVVFVNSFTNRQYVETLTALHETSHNLGAGGRADSNHGDCVMSYNRDNEILYQFFGSEDVSKYNDLYCASCYNAIVTFLAHNY